MSKESLVQFIQMAPADAQLTEELQNARSYEEVKTSLRGWASNLAS